MLPDRSSRAECEGQRRLLEQLGRECARLRALERARQAERSRDGSAPPDATTGDIMDSAAWHELSSLRRLAGGVWQGAAAREQAQAGRDLVEAVGENPFATESLWAELHLQYQCVAELEDALSLAERTAARGREEG
jgi:hypothetical protein